MRIALGMLLSVSLVGCAHLNREEVLATTAWDVMTDAEVATVALHEALGELHDVQQVDADGQVIAGRAAFLDRDDRLAYEARLDRILRARIYGQGPTLELLRIRCEQLHQAGWASWPGDAAARRAACEYGDVSVTLHSLYKKPLLQRALVDTLLAVTGDSVQAAQTKLRLLQLERTGIEPYVVAVEQWDSVEGFRPKG